MKRGDFDGRKRIFLIVFIFMIIFSVILIFFAYNSYFNLFDSISARASSNVQADISFTIEGAEAEPTPTPAPAAAVAAGSTGGAGGSGGGKTGSDTRSFTAPDFIVDQALIKVISKVGETFKKSITISNPNSGVLRFKAFTSLTDMIYLSESEFEIPPKSEKTIFLTFAATEDLEPEVYTGKLFIKSQYTGKEIPIIYEVRTKKSLFDVSLNIPAEYKRLSPGDGLFFQVTLLNLGEIGKVDVALEYSIKDFEGKVIKTLAETTAVETQASFSKTIILPENIALGDYVVSVKAKYGLTVGTASDVFSIVDINEILLSPQYQKFIMVLIILIILILLFIIYELRKGRLKNVVARQNKELTNINKKISGKKVTAGEAEEDIKKLKNQYSLLEEAYKKGYITKQSYDDGRNKINSLMNKLEKGL